MGAKAKSAQSQLRLSQLAQSKRVLNKSPTNTLALSQQATFLKRARICYHPCGVFSAEFGNNIFLRIAGSVTLQFTRVQNVKIRRTVITTLLPGTVFIGPYPLDCTDTLSFREPLTFLDCDKITITKTMACEITLALALEEWQ